MLSSHCYDILHCDVQMINQWIFRGYVEKDATGRYVKTNTYLRRGLR